MWYARLPFLPAARPLAKREHVFVLDTPLREDACRVRTDQSPFVMSTIRHALLNTARRLHASPTALCEFYAAKTPALLQTFGIL